MSNSFDNNDCSQAGSAPTRTIWRRDEATAMDALSLSNALRHQQQHRDEEGESPEAAASSLQQSRDRTSRDWQALEAPILLRPLYYTVSQPNDSSSSVTTALGSPLMQRIRQRRQLLVSLNVTAPEGECRPVSRANLYGILQEALEISSGCDLGVANTRAAGQEDAVEGGDQEQEQ